MEKTKKPNSRLPGFNTLTVEGRRVQLIAAAGASGPEWADHAAAGLGVEAADHMI